MTLTDSCPTDDQVPEDRRLRRLHQLGLLDTQAEALLDHFTELAATATGMPISLISVIDEDRQWFKSAVGLPQGMQTHRDFAFCAHAHHTAELFEVHDAHLDPRFAENPLVTGEPFIRHYAGAALVMPGGEFIGTLCVINRQPGRLEEPGRSLLRKLAHSLVSVLLMRENEHRLNSRLKAKQALQESEARYKAIAAKLEQADRRKDEFLAMLAHELRNPLAPISTAAHLLGMRPDDTQAVLRASALITRQVAHMTELVDDLLDVARVTRGQVRIDRETVCLQQVVHEGLEQVRPQLEARRHALSMQLPPQPLHVDGDRARLVQVVANLLSNAAKYTPDDGRIDVSLQAVGPSAVLTVQDNGIGIDADLLPCVFDLFTQATRTPDRAQGGLGVGLALVRSLVTLHGGSVGASSAGAGQGSTFTVTLPLVQGQEQPAAAPAASPQEAHAGMRVMVVDDNVDAAQLLGEWLDELGYQVTVKTDPYEALAAAQEQPAQAYLLDIGLPGMDGNELARALRADPRTRDALLVAVTGYAQPQDIARSRQAGFDHHVVKPADPQRLLSLLAQVPGAPNAAPAAG